MYTFRHEYLYKLRRHYREFLFFFTFMYIRRFLQDRIFTGVQKRTCTNFKKNLPMNFRRNIEKKFHEVNVHNKSA